MNTRVGEAAGPGMSSPWKSLVALSVFLGLVPVQAQVPVPELGGHLTDTAGFLATDERGEIHDRLVAFEKKTGAQIFVLTVASTGGESIEDFSQRVFESWKPGRRGIDDGVLFVIRTEDGSMRIHTGYGAEGALPDVVCKRILDRMVAPAFRDNQRAGGIHRGLDAIMLALEKEPLPEVITARWQSSTFSDHMGWFIGGTVSLLAAVLLVIRKSRWAVMALIINAGVWIPALLFLPEIVEAPALVQRICIVLAGFAGFVSIGHFVMTINTGSSVTGGGSGGSSPSGSGDSGSSSGSWGSSSSGGGGESGGGGASSRW